MQHAEFPSCLRFSFTGNKLEKSRKPSSSACACLCHDWNEQTVANPCHPDPSIACPMDRAKSTGTYRRGHFNACFLSCFPAQERTNQRPDPFQFFFQCEMARVEKMELCTGKVSFEEFSTLHCEDSVVFAPGDQRGGLFFAEILLPVGKDVQIPFCVVEDCQ